MATQNIKIKYDTTTTANTNLTEHNKKLQEDLNNALANQENLEREVNTQKEIMKQMEVNRKEYIQKLKKELETVEERFQVKVEQMEMVGQDYLSSAAQNVVEYNIMKGRYEETRMLLEESEKQVLQHKAEILNAQ